MTFTNKNDVLLEINNMLKEYKKSSLDKYKKNKVYKILLFLKNFLTVENIRTAKKYIFENDIDRLADISSNRTIMTITFEDKILNENKIIVNKLTNNIDPYFYIRTDVCIYWNSILTYYDIFVDDNSSYEYIFQRLSLEDKFKFFIKKETLIGTKTIKEYIEYINKKTYDIKDCFLNMSISKEKILKYLLYKYKKDNTMVKKLVDFLDVFFSSNNKMTISNLYEFVKILEIAEKNSVMYVLSNIVCGEETYEGKI
jgi:hypothetical protein